VVEQTARAVVAVVEDDVPSRVALGRLLAAGGFEPALFDSAEAYMQAPPCRPPLCLILDVHLGGMSGIDLQRQLREAGSTLPIIVTTGKREEVIQDRAQAFGCTAFLWKPFTADALLTLIGSIARDVRG
jgi:FixJ family two-component response regulator